LFRAPTRIKESERLVTIEMAPNFWRATAHYGFMERPDIPNLLKQAREQGCPLVFDDITYYVGHGTIIHRGDGKGLAEWEEALFAAMERNAVHVSDFFTRQRRRNRPAGRDLIFSAHAAEPWHALALLTISVER
jgi:KUP system potassium uptake protein